MELLGVAFTISIIIAMLLIYIGIRKYRDEENKKVMDNIEKNVVRYFQVAFLFVIIGISILVIGFCINIVNR
mgnify:FL=1